MSSLTEQVREIFNKFAPERAREMQMHTDAERAALITQLKGIETAQIETWTKTSKEFNAANTAWVDLTKQTQAAQNELLRVGANRNHLNFSYENQKRQLALQLKSTAPGCLKEFADEIMAEQERLRKIEMYRQEGPIGYRGASNEPVFRSLSAKASIDARRAALYDDFQWASEVAHTECATAEQAETAIEKRRAAWPEIEYVKVA